MEKFSLLNGLDSMLSSIRTSYTAFVFHFNYWFKSYGDVKYLIPNRFILPRGGVVSVRACLLVPTGATPSSFLPSVKINVLFISLIISEYGM